MQSMKIIGIAVSVGGVLLLSTPAIAGPHGGRMEKRVARLQERLGLSDAQADEVFEIFQEAKQTGNCRQLEDRSQRRACWQEKRQAIDEELATVLTQEQLAELEAFRAERKARWAEGKGKQ